jgi:hypothetical protein
MDTELPTGTRRFVSAADMKALAGGALVSTTSLGAGMAVGVAIADSSPRATSPAAAVLATSPNSGSLPSGTRLPGIDQALLQIGIPARIGTTSHDDLPGDEESADSAAVYDAFFSLID